MRKTVLAVIVIIILLIAAVGCYFVFYRACREPTEHVFFEEVPAWSMSDPAVIKLVIEPDRADPGDSAVFYAFVRNIGPGATGSDNLIFLVNDTEVGRETVGLLEPSAEVKVNATWTAEKPGRYWVVALLELEENTFDRDDYNNIQTGILRISGGLPEPELEVELADLESFHPIPGESYNITLNFRNPSFTDVRDIPVELYIDGEIIGNDTIKYLAQGTRQDLQFQWDHVIPGEHVIQVQMDLPEEFPYADLQRLKSWHITSPESTKLYDLIQKDKWVSIGPRILTNGADGLPTGSVGRVNTIAFHPTNKDIMYVGAVTGGIWKTTDGGDGWTPLTDKLLPFSVTHALTVDYEHPEIVYFGTGSSVYGGGIGIYKSIDGGTTWTPFATKILAPTSPSDLNIGGVSRLVIRYVSPTAGDFVIYAATEIGVLRYRSTNPLATVSQPNEWTQIKSGKVDDIAVDPIDSNLVYASVMGEGLFYTTKGLTATKDADWNKIALPSLTKTTGEWFTFDVYWGNPRTVFAALTSPSSGFALGIYKSVWPHNSWSDVRLCKEKEHYPLYNPFIRVHPQNPDLIYFSGVKLYKRYIASGKEILIEGIHDDMHGMEWSPHEPNTYYIGCDGGMWRCNVKFEVTDSCVHRNNDLRVTQFYDFDASQTNTNLMIGGTQDCGTILYQGTLDWKIIKDGDGAYSLIGPGDQIFYAQNQYLNDTSRSDKGASTGWGDWKLAKGTASLILPEERKWAGYNGESYITVHPLDANTVLAQGNQVYYTDDGGATWEPKGPKGISVKGDVRRVVVQPQTNDWFVGTSKGQIWYTQDGGSSWHLIDSHPDSANIVSMAFAPTNHEVLYVAYQGCDPYRRVERLERTQGGSWIGSYISFNLPVNVLVTAITGDGYNDSVVYVGTDHGVFHGDVTKPTYDTWHPYNDGLPLIKINDLLVDKTSKQLRAATWGRGAWSVITGP